MGTQACHDIDILQKYDIDIDIRYESMDIESFDIDIDIQVRYRYVFDIDISRKCRYFDIDIDIFFDIDLQKISSRYSYFWHVIITARESSSRVQMGETDPALDYTIEQTECTHDSSGPD